MACATGECGVGGLLGKAAAIVCLGALAGLAHSRLRPVQLEMAVKPPAIEPAALPRPQAAGPAPETSGVLPAAKMPQPGPQAATPPAAPPAALGTDITLDQAWALFQQGTLFLDARHAKDYEEGHVDGALLMPAEEFQERLTKVMPYKTSPIVIYCGGGACDASHNLGILLQQSGFTDLHIMTDGFPGWKGAGRPVATGPEK